MVLHYAESNLLFGPPMVKILVSSCDSKRIAGPIDQKVKFLVRKMKWGLALEVNNVPTYICRSWKMIYVHVHLLC